MTHLRLLFGLALVLALAACQSAPNSLEQPLAARFHLEAQPGQPGTQMILPASKAVVMVMPNAVLRESDITDANLVRLDAGWCIAVRFTPAAAREIYRFTSANVGRRLVMTLNNQPACVWRIERAVTEGMLPMFAEIPPGELPPLVERIKRTSVKTAGASH